MEDAAAAGVECVGLCAALDEKREEVRMARRGGPVQRGLEFRAGKGKTDESGNGICDVSGLEWNDLMRMLTRVSMISMVMML